MHAQTFQSMSDLNIWFLIKRVPQIGAFWCDFIEGSIAASKPFRFAKWQTAY
jgi:hypothetical protein